LADDGYDLDTGTEELLARVEQGVAVVTLNRPGVRNALGDVISPALRSTIARLGTASDVRCVVLTGTGRAFCSGGDVKGMGGRTPRRVDAPSTPEDIVVDQTERQRALTGALYALPMPTIAALNGAAAGAGLAIALACDLRIAAESAFVTTGFRNVGLPGDYGVSFFLTQLVGTARARELFFTAERVPASRCEALGIVNRVVPDDRLMQESMSLARDLAAGPPIAFKLMKENLDRALRSDLPTCLAHEAAATVEAFQTADHREAVSAFIEKRTPRFEGR
jgi:enoyl-CoA hydratase/carnithine racemase